MSMYKVYYSGFAYVEADSEDEAREDYDFNSVYSEESVDEIEEVDEFIVEV